MRLSGGDTHVKAGINGMRSHMNKEQKHGGMEFFFACFSGSDVIHLQQKRASNHRCCRFNVTLDVSRQLLIS